VRARPFARTTILSGLRRRVDREGAVVDADGSSPVSVWIVGWEALMHADFVRRRRTSSVRSGTLHRLHGRVLGGARHAHRDRDPLRQRDGPGVGGVELA
jgi:hypothetical protein